VQLEHSFTVPVGIDVAWTVLLDIDRVAACMPGAHVDSVHGDDFTGTVKVKLGPINLTYKGKASFIEKDESAHRAVIDARGRDARGNGTASAKVTAVLVENGPSTDVDVITDLDITGKPAQFGRGVMVDVGNKLIGQFADCLAAQLTAGDHPTAAEPPTEQAPAESPVEPAEEVAAPPAAKSQPESGPATPVETATKPGPASVPRRSIDDVEPIDLIQSAGPAVAKRLLPLLAVIMLVLLALRHRRSHHTA